jgi:hypothetical protein
LGKFSPRQPTQFFQMIFSALLFALSHTAMNYMNTTPSEYLNLTYYKEQIPDFSKFNMTFTFPTIYKNISYPTTFQTFEVSESPWAVYYFLSGALFYFATAWILMSKPNEFQAIDGVASMSDFTKTKLRQQISSEYKPKREIMNLVESNGMDFEEFLNRMVGNTKRRRASVH